MKTFNSLLIELTACRPAKDWAGNMQIEEVVEKCHRGDWLLWLASKINIDIRQLTLTKGYCAKTVYHIMTDERSRNAVDVAIAFGEGKATFEELNIAYINAAAALDELNVIDITDTIVFAAEAGEVVADLISGSSVATCTMNSINDKSNQLETANICRKYIGNLIIEKVNLLLNE